MTKHSDNHSNGITSSDEEAGSSSVAERIHDILDNASSEALSLAKTNWYFGEWEALRDIDIEKFVDHPDAGLLAALKAMGYQQLHDIDKARQYVRTARELGCGQDIISRLLVAGVHNTLGKVAALQQNNDKAQQHFKESVDLGAKKQQARLASHARSVKEIAKLGLLPQAMKLIEIEKASVSSVITSEKDYEAKMAILNSEIAFVNHELSRAYQKKQLYALSKNINNNQDKVDIEALRNLSPSQLGQDIWVLEKTDFKKKGFFVEFGATDGVQLSNTYLLETEFDWEGICAEPNPEYYQQLQKNRKCTVSDACILDKTGDKVNFVLAKEFGGIDGIATNSKHKEKVNRYKTVGECIEVTTISLDAFLKENKAPKDIDYLSIDTEGSEYQILKNFPFEDWNIRCITVEHNYEGQREQIRELLVEYGYEFEERKWDDWYYKNNV